jgi:hypothetical protein
MKPAFRAGSTFDAPARARIAGRGSGASSGDEHLSGARFSPPRRAALRWLAAPGALALVIAACARVLPIAAPAYAAIGLPVNLIGLELRNVRSRIVTEGARKVLTIDGEIANLRRESLRAPPVALTVRGENGQAKYAWTTQAPKARLEGGETIAFRARLASPPADGADVLVRFAKVEEARDAAR